MDSNTYQKLAQRTLGQIDAPIDASSKDIRLAWMALGLTGEAGELAELIKKQVFHKHEASREKVVKELGDVMWYVASICTMLDIPLSDVLNGNIQKIAERYPDGFSVEASKARVDLQGA